MKPVFGKNGHKICPSCESRIKECQACGKCYSRDCWSEFCAKCSKKVSDAKRKAVKAIRDMTSSL